MQNLDEIVSSLNNMTIPEIVTLTKLLEVEWNVVAAPSVQVQSPQQVEEKKVEQTEFTVMLTSVPSDKKINIIKAVRDILGATLIEAKGIVEAAPKMIKDQLSADDATALKAKLVEAGAICEVK